MSIIRHLPGIYSLLLILTIYFEVRRGRPQPLLPEVQIDGDGKYDDIRYYYYNVKYYYYYFTWYCAILIKTTRVAQGTKVPFYEYLKT